MDLDDKQKIATLEARIADLEKALDFRAEQTKHNFLAMQEFCKKGDDALWSLCQKISADIVKMEENRRFSHNNYIKTDKVIAENIAIIEKKLIKYDDVYYHVFPERLIPDARLLDQLESLRKPTPDADSKKE